MTEWNKFMKLLEVTFSRTELDNKALQHLEYAYHEIESMWLKFNEHNSARRVILGEATLFKDRSYIYNEETQNSSFLRPSDFPGESKGDKNSLLSLLKEYGVMIVDLYPFAFNDTDTPNVTYSKKLKSRRYNSFLKSSFDLYGKKKIEAIIKENPDVEIAFRYRRNHLFLHNDLDELLTTHSATAKRSRSLHGNISIDREKLQKFLM